MNITEQDWKWAESALLFRDIIPNKEKKMEQNHDAIIETVDGEDLPWTSDDIVIDTLAEPRDGESEVNIQTTEDVGPADKSIPL